MRAHCTLASLVELPTIFVAQLQKCIVGRLYNKCLGIPTNNPLSTLQIRPTLKSAHIDSCNQRATAKSLDLFEFQTRRSCLWAVGQGRRESFPSSKWYLRQHGPAQMAVNQMPYSPLGIFLPFEQTCAASWLHRPRYCLSQKLGLGPGASTFFVGWLGQRENMLLVEREKQQLSILQAPAWSRIGSRIKSSSQALVAVAINQRTMGGVDKWLHDCD
jgi:hypothetical protein